MNIASILAARPYLTNKIPADAEISGVTTTAPASTQGRPGPGGVSSIALASAGITGRIVSSGLSIDPTKTKQPTPAMIADIKRQNQVIRDALEITNAGLPPSGESPYGRLTEYMNAAKATVTTLDVKA